MVFSSENNDASGPDTTAVNLVLSLFVVVIIVVVIAIAANTSMPTNHNIMRFHDGSFFAVCPDFLLLRIKHPFPVRKYIRNENVKSQAK